jgi:hypothetical protein
MVMERNSAGELSAAEVFAAETKQRAAGAAK